MKISNFVFKLLDLSRKYPSLTTAINKMDTVTVENLKASTKSKIDWSL